MFICLFIGKVQLVNITMVYVNDMSDILAEI